VNYHEVERQRCLYICGSDLFTGDEEGAHITYMLPSLWTSRPPAHQPKIFPIQSQSNTPKYVFILRGQSFTKPTFFTIFKFSTAFFDDFLKIFDSSWHFFLESFECGVRGCVRLWTKLNSIHSKLKKINWVLKIAKNGHLF